MQNVGIELRSLTNIVMRRLEKRAKDKAESVDLSGVNGWIIGYLSENSDRSVYQRELEDKFGITRSTASKVISLMVRKGLIEKVSDPSDARVNKLTLTKRAEEIAETLRKESDVIAGLLTKGFSETDMENLRNYIWRMKENLRNED